MNIYIIFLLFISFSFIGWLLEVIYAYIKNEKLINRGFLIGPICPVYGIGALLMLYFLYDYRDNFITLFFMSIIIFTILEYFTSFIMEKLFSLRWWDYSTRKYNVNGRVCLETMVPFGLLGLLVMYVLNPFIYGLIMNLDYTIIVILSICLFIIFILDLIISCYILHKYRYLLKNTKRDITVDLSTKVRRVLLSKNLLYRRYVSAFPNAMTKRELLLKIKKNTEKKLKIEQKKG